MPEKNLVFLSYAHDDLDMVWKIYNGLKERKVNVWLDKDNNIKPGRWYPQIKKKIYQSKYFIFCVSQAAIKKTGGGGEKPGFCDKELQRAYELAMNQSDDKFTIIPVRLEDCERGDHRLSIFQQYDLFTDFENNLDNLAVNLEGISLSDAKAKDGRTEDEKLIEGLTGKGYVAYFSGDFKTALHLYESLIKINPKDNLSWFNKGAALRDLGKHEEALKAFEKAIELDPKLAAPWNGKGNAQWALGRYEEALEAYEKAIELDPKYAYPWNGKGNALRNLGKHEEAIKAFEKAIELDSKLAIPWYGKGNAQWALGKYEEAIKAYDKSIGLDPKSAAPWNGKGNALSDLGKYEEALEAYETALKILEKTKGKDHPLTNLVRDNLAKAKKEF